MIFTLYSCSCGGLHEMIFLVRSNSISGKAQLGHDVLSCSNVTGFSLLMFHLFRVLKCMFVSEFDLLFIFFCTIHARCGVK